MEAVVKSPCEAVMQAAKHILEDGHETSPRGMKTKEILNFTVQINEPTRLPLVVPGRGLTDFIGAAEAVQLIGQFSDPDWMVSTVKAFDQFRDGNILWGAYGIRVYGMLDELVKLLREDPSSRQAVLSIYHSPTDLGRGKKDTPCTLTLQFLLRDGYLHGRGSMRSNDVWLGLPYDLVQFISITGAIAAALDVKVGTYTHTVGSMHVYERHYEMLEEITSGEPDDFEIHESLFMSRPIEDITRDCRLMVMNPEAIDVTVLSDYEKWLMEAVNP